jgi:hypothetical protein
MNWFRLAAKTLIWTWLVGAICFSAFFTLEYKNSLVIEGPEAKFQRIEAATNIVELKRTSRMYVDFLYGVHGASLRLWKISLIYGLVNIALAGCCAASLRRSSRAKVANND